MNLTQWLIFRYEHLDGSAISGNKIINFSCFSRNSNPILVVLYSPVIFEYSMRPVFITKDIYIE